MWVEGNFDQRVYDPYDFNVLANERAPEPVFLSYTPVPPISVVFYSPFVFFQTIYWAKFCFNVLGLFLFLLALYRLIRHLDINRTPFLILIPIIFYGPILNNFFQGQSYLYLLAFIFEAFRQWDRGRIILAAVWWSLAIALKIFPAILVLFLLFQKDKRIVFWVIGFAAVLSLSAFVFLPWEVPFNYFTKILPRLSQGQIHDPFAILFQSVDVLLKHCFVKDELLNSTPLWPSPWLAVVLSLLFKALVLSGTIWILVQEKGPVFLRFTMVLFAGLLLVGYGSSYSLMLALPLFVAITIWEIPLRLQLVLALLFLLFCNVPIYRLYEFPMFLQFPRLYAMLAVMGLMFWQLRPSFDVKIGGLILGLMLIKGLVFDFYKADLNEYYLAEISYGIVDHYDYKEGVLSLSYFDQYGMQQREFPISDRLKTDPELSVVNNQVYYQGRQMTDNKGQKKQPMLLNNDEILYLSDEGRGVGFYILRRVKMW